MTGPAWLCEAGNALLDFLYPPVCYLCGAVGEWVCAECVAAWERPGPPACAACGGSLEGGPCRWCAGGPSPLSGAGFACLFEGGAREAVHLLKYSAKRRLAPVMAEAMAFVARTSPALQGVDALVPVALHPARQRRRGYNQSEWLARGLADALGVPVAAWLARARDTRPQVGLSLSERQDNVRGAFEALPACAGANVLLVDDVTTTGATARDAARALRAAGARSVRLLTFARDA